MTEELVYTKLSEIIRTLFDEYEGPVNAGLTAKSVKQWDSLANVQLMVLAEQAFKIRFGVDEMTGLKNVGELVALILRKSTVSAR
jgi:acyl carrier protein